MFADIQRLENAARLSMGTFQEADAAAPARQVSYGLQMAVLLAALAAPCIALLMYY